MLLEPSFIGEYGEIMFKTVLSLSGFTALFVAYGPFKNRGKDVEIQNRERHLNVWRREVNRFMAQCERLVEDSQIHGRAAANSALRKRATILRARLDDKDKAQAILSNRIATCARTAILASNQTGRLQDAFEQTRIAASTVFTNDSRFAVQKMGRT